MMSKAKRDNPEFNTYQKLADRDRADLAFEIQLKTISDNATKKPSDIKSEPMSGVTQAMIEDYQAEQMQPIEIEGQFFKYHPAGADKVVLDPMPPLEPVISEADVRRAKGIRMNRASEIERLKEEITVLTRLLERDRRQFDIDIAAAKGKAGAAKLRLNITDAFNKSKIMIEDQVIEEETYQEISNRKYEKNILNGTKIVVESEIQDQLKEQKDTREK